MRTLSILVLILAHSACAAGGLKVMQAFGTGNLDKGNDLYAGLILDASGNLYGAAESGGTSGAGVVYELSPNGSGWTETVLYNFKGGTGDGAGPHATLMKDSAGNLYGTTANGGLTGAACGNGCGTVYMLAPAAGGWQESVLYRFTGGADGAIPYAGVAMDSAGNLYGATISGGAFNAGAVYKLAPESSGAWTQTVLYSFQGRPDGAAPYATPLLDAAGNLYGTTGVGGAHNLGIVYMLAPQPDGSFAEHVLHTFAGADGANPEAGLILDPRGDLYGTATLGGTANCGTAFKLARNASGGWTERLLHTFLGVNAQDGENPNGLTLDARGNLYGTTTGGGTDNPGTIFKMTRNSSGDWTETVLYNFTAGATGAYPSSGVVLDPAGQIYGTTLWGGPFGDTTGGVAFQFTP